MEQEFFVQLFVELDPNIRLPTVGVLITMMFKEQNISFTKVNNLIVSYIPLFIVFLSADPIETSRSSAKIFKGVQNLPKNCTWFEAEHCRDHWLW